MPTFSQQLKTARGTRKLTQGALAAQVGTSQATISQWETGKATPSTEQRARLREVLGSFDRQGTLPLIPPATTHAANVAIIQAITSGVGFSQPRKTMKQTETTRDTGNIGFETILWDAADKLRNNVDPAEYKHVVLGLLFLKYISDAFEDQRRVITERVADPDSDFHAPEGPERDAILAMLLEDRDAYAADNVFWVPEGARWSRLQALAKQSEITIQSVTGKEKKVTVGGFIDHTMDLIEQENPRLRGILPKVYASPGLEQVDLGALIDSFSELGLGGREHQARDTLGRVYEYFLGRFAGAEGKGGGEFFTPSSVVRLLVEMLEPYHGRVFDPCCGSGGMFVQSLKFIEQHNGQRNDISVFGQESNYTTWKLARMNLAIRGIEANLGSKHSDSFLEDLHPDLRADYILANPPFNISAWGSEGLAEDVRWKYGVPPSGNANYAWMQHFLHHLAPGGTAGFVMANGSMSSMTSGEGDIRQKLVEADLVDCMVALPGQLFYSTQIPVCLWFLTRSKAGKGKRSRKGETLFIDARKLGTMETRVHRVLEAADMAKIADTYHAWRNPDGGYEDVAGFCKAAKFAEIKAHDFVLTPGRYVGAEEVEDDGEPFEEKMERLTTELGQHLAEGQRLERQIREALGGLGYGI